MAVAAAVGSQQQQQQQCQLQRPLHYYLFPTTATKGVREQRSASRAGDPADATTAPPSSNARAGTCDAACLPTPPSLLCSSTVHSSSLLLLVEVQRRAAQQHTLVNGQADNCSCRRHQCCRCTSYPQPAAIRHSVCGASDRRHPAPPLASSSRRQFYTPALCAPTPGVLRCTAAEHRRDAAPPPHVRHTMQRLLT